MGCLPHPRFGSPVSGSCAAAAGSCPVWASAGVAVCGPADFHGDCCHCVRDHAGPVAVFLLDGVVATNEQRHDTGGRALLVRAVVSLRRSCVDGSMASGSIRWRPPLIPAGVTSQLCVVWALHSDEALRERGVVAESASSRVAAACAHVLDRSTGTVHKCARENRRRTADAAGGPAIAWRGWRGGGPP